MAEPHDDDPNQDPEIAAALAEIKQVLRPGENPYAPSLDRAKPAAAEPSERVVYERRQLPKPADHQTLPKMSVVVQVEKYRPTIRTRVVGGVPDGSGADAALGSDAGAAAAPVASDQPPAVAPRGGEPSTRRRLGLALALLALVGALLVAMFTRRVEHTAPSEPGAHASATTTSAPAAPPPPAPTATPSAAEADPPSAPSAPAEAVPAPSPHTPHSATGEPHRKPAPPPPPPAAASSAPGRVWIK